MAFLKKARAKLTPNKGRTTGGDRRNAKREGRRSRRAEKRDKKAERKLQRINARQGTMQALIGGAKDLVSNLTGGKGEQGETPVAFSTSMPEIPITGERMSNPNPLIDGGSSEQAPQSKNKMIMIIGALVVVGIAIFAFMKKGNKNK